MKLFYFVSLCQCMLVVNCTSITKLSCKAEIVLKILPQSDTKKNSILRPTDQKLANQLLPIWTINKTSSHTLQRMDDVMQGVGRFTMYQDPETTTAAVFFHDRLQFDGIVDSRYIIKGLIWDPRDKSIKKPHKSGLKIRKPSRFFTDTLPRDESSSSLNSQNTPMMDILDEEAEPSRSQLADLKINYVEILVMVNYDIVEEFHSKPDDYSSIVSYILVLFNNVDMLFSKIKDQIIKFNLAGIVIGNNRESFPLYLKGKCYEQINDVNGGVVDSMDVRCTNEFIRSFCDKHAKIIPAGTYDIAVLLTRYDLHQHEYNPKTGDKKLVRLGGLAESPKDEYYELMKMGTMPTLVATISDRGEYESFPIIAHEIAHLFDVDHDEPTGEKNKLMQSNGKHIMNSLSWSRASTKSLAEFFESHNSCIFRNKPGSLYPPGPRKILDADQQCRCYGYKSVTTNIISRLVGNIGAECDDNIQCEDKMGTYYEGPIFMDGTPCGRNKVCWAANCVDIRG